MVNDWSKWGRKVDEWVTGDIVVDDLDHGLIGAITKIEGDIIFTTFDDTGIHKRDITMVCPWHNRCDIDDVIKEALK